MTKKKKSILSDQRFIVLLVIIVLFAIFSFKSREFRQYTTILSMLDFSYYDLLMAIGVTFPLITESGNKEHFVLIKPVGKTMPDQSMYPLIQK